MNYGLFLRMLGVSGVGGGFTLMLTTLLGSWFEEFRLFPAESQFLVYMAGFIIFAVSLILCFLLAAYESHRKEKLPWE